MADSATRKDNSSRKGKKRKPTNSEDSEKLSKAARQKIEREQEFTMQEEIVTVSSMEVEGEERTKIKYGRQWRNLELVLAIQNKELTSHKKVELIFDFLKSRANKEDDGTEQDFNTLSISRLITYISNWIQSLLIGSEKKIRAEDKESEESQLCLDCRCWEIFKFCLEESSSLHVSLSLSRDLLRVISCVSRCALGLCNSVHTGIKEYTSTSVEFQFYNTVSNCIKVLFSSHGQSLSGNLDLWAVAVSSMLELVIKIFGNNFQDSGMENLLIQFSCLVLEPFSKFLRVHPCRKNGFRDFVDKLLEPLLHLLGLLHDQIKDNTPVLVKNLVKLVEDILCYGLFHSVHLDEYLSLHIKEKYCPSADGKLEVTRTIIKSYHRHLFDKLENLISEKKVHALAGIGEMFRLFVDCVKKQKRDSPNTESSSLMESHSRKNFSKVTNLTSEKSDDKSTPSLETRNSIFDFFVLTMEPLLLDLRKHLQSDFQPGNSMLDVYYALKSVNNILSSMVLEQVYVRTEDNSEGACLNFFRITYGLLLSCYVKFNKLWQLTCGVGPFAQFEILNSIAKEFIISVGNFLKIEYEVIGDDLVGTWIMILTFLAMMHSSEDIPELSSLFSGTVELGCRMVNLYSELRQVNHAVFALCKGLRHLLFYQGDGEMKFSELLSSNSTIHHDMFTKSGHLLLCSQKFRLAICNAIKSIPEGQASGFIHTLMDDISDSLEWMKVGNTNSSRFSLQAELLGMVLSEIYSLVLDSLSVTSGNSYPMGVSIKNLITVPSASMSCLIAQERDNTDEFLYSVMGITSESNTLRGKNDFQEKIPFIILFFFRLYVSCRSLYRQAVSLMPPDSSRKMSGLMADLYTSYSGQDCMEGTDFEDEGYFSWIVRPSASLLSVLQFIKDIFLLENSTDYSCLIYVMHIMAFQRLVDLNRQIQSIEYVVQRSEKVTLSKLRDDDDIISLRENKSKQERFLSCLKQEAAGLTGFIMEYLSLIDEKQLLTPKKSSSPEHMEFDSWDVGICTVNKKTLPTAIWRIMCQNIDVWCNHATKKKLKSFLSLLILNSLPYGTPGEFEERSWKYPGEAMKVSRCQISREHLHDTNLNDQRFMRRYMASRLCNVLGKCVSLLFKDSTNTDADLSSFDWTKFSSLLHNSSIAVRDKPLTSCSTYGNMSKECCNKQTSFSPISLNVAACRNLMNLMCQMMERSLSFKSFSSCVTHLLNFERLLVGSMLGHHELLGLMVSCRRALKYLMISFCEEKLETNKYSNLPIFSGRPSPILWLLKSMNLVVASSNTLSSENNDGQVNDMIFSLMDHTSYVFFTLSKHQFSLAIYSITRPKNTSYSNEFDDEACKSVIIMVKTLEDEIESLLLSLKEAFNSRNSEVDIQLADYTRLSSVVSCTRGFLWGLESTLNDIGVSDSDLKPKLMKRRHKTISEINNFIGKLVEFIGISSQIFLCKGQPLKNLCDGEEQLSGLADFGSFNYDSLRIDFLESFLSGQNIEAAFFLRGLFIATSAIVRFMLINCSPLPSNLIQTFLGCSEVLLTRFSCMVDMPKPSSFVWLDGTLKFLEALGGLFPSTTPAATRDIYTKLIELHLKAIGKCISLQGKKATLVSHDIESSAKIFSIVSESTLSDIYGLDDLKSRLRMSFKVFIEKSSEIHLLSAIQALERALLGVREGCTMIYEVQRENTDGGMVSSMVAAGVDCLDLILEIVKGNERLNLVRRHINGLIASLFNIMVHLQGPEIFYRKPDNITMNKNPDSGSVVVMCVEVLTRVSGKHALFHLDSYHVGHSLHIPSKLFQGFHNLRAEKTSHPSPPRFIDGKEYEHLESHFLVDRQFSVSLYASSCRLLWTVVKHRKSECIRCIALLQNSLQALLHSLEIVNTYSADRKGYFTWEVEEGVKCASYLRRVYEEIRQQKDVLGRHCFMFLSDYIWLYSGYGPLKKGIKREVDEALRPGVYALIDVCSKDDLQYLHTVFGEGPCRSTLARLQHDYKLHFQYEGKV